MLKVAFAYESSIYSILHEMLLRRLDSASKLFKKHVCVCAQFPEICLVSPRGCSVGIFLKICWYFVCVLLVICKCFVGALLVFCWCSVDVLWSIICSVGLLWCTEL